MERANDYPPTVDVIEIRHRNLRALVRTLEDRGVRLRKDQAQALGGLGSSFLSQLLRGKKMGEDVARKIEAAMSRSHGWMDRSPGTEGVAAGVQSIDDMLAWLSDRLCGASPGVRGAVGELLLGFATHPPDRPRLAEALRALLG